MIHLQHVSRLDNLNHTEAGSALSLSGIYAAVKVRKKLYVIRTNKENLEKVMGIFEVFDDMAVLTFSFN